MALRAWSLVHLEGAANMRDAGGWRSARSRGLIVRAGVLFRSDSLHRITSTDCDRLESLGIKTIIDLRTDAEHASMGRVPAGTARELRFPMAIRSRAGSRAGAVGVTPQGLAGLYLDLVEQSKDTLGKIFSALSDPANVPAVVQCAAGKDRTGIVIALLLSWLGVARVDIAADYAATGASWDRFLALVRSDLDSRRRADLAAFPAQFLSADPATMIMFLDRVAALYGSTAELMRSAGLDSQAAAGLEAQLTCRENCASDRHRHYTTRDPEPAGLEVGQ